MSLLQRVCLLLSVAVLLREGSANSPLDFLRDLKNRIFPSGNTTEPKNNTSLQCSDHDQVGVCALKNPTVNETSDETIENTEIFEVPDSVNGTQRLYNDTSDISQLEGNLTTIEDTYDGNNTQYYDEQNWNSTADYNTHYPETGTALNEDDNDRYNETGKIRSKRQINKVKINISLETPGVLTNKTIVMSTTVLTGKPANSTVNSNTTQSSNLTEGQQVISKGNENRPGSIQNENEKPIAKILLNTTENVTFVVSGISGNETKNMSVIINSGQNINESKNTTLDSSENLLISSSNDTMVDIPELQNITEEANNNGSTSLNCSNFVDVKEGSTNLQNISLSLDKNLNGTNTYEHAADRVDEISTQANGSSTASITNITKLKDMLENSTQIIEKIVQTIAPAISITSTRTETDENNDTSLESLHNIKIKEKNNLTNIIKSNITEAGNKDKNNMQPISTVITTNITRAENGNITDNSNKTFSINGQNLNKSETSVQNVNKSVIFENNITDKDELNASTNVTDKDVLNESTEIDKEVINASTNVTDRQVINESNPIKNYTESVRKKRSMVFTILSEDEPDYSVQTPAEATESPVTELTSSSLSSSTESSLGNGTQSVEVVGPICTKRYQQCVNSTECCENYECVGVEDNNSTSYCDLRPVNVILSTSQPFAANNADTPQ